MGEHRGSWGVPDLGVTGGGCCPPNPLGWRERDPLKRVSQGLGILLRARAPLDPPKAPWEPLKENPKPPKALSEPSHLQSLWEWGDTQGLKPSLSLMYPLDGFGT